MFSSLSFVVFSLLGTEKENRELNELSSLKFCLVRSLSPPYPFLLYFTFKSLFYIILIIPNILSQCVECLYKFTSDMIEEKLKYSGITTTEFLIKSYKTKPQIVIDLFGDILFDSTYRSFLLFCGIQSLQKTTSCAISDSWILNICADI